MMSIRRQLTANRICRPLEEHAHLYLFQIFECPLGRQKARDQMVGVSLANDRSLSAETERLCAGRRRLREVANAVLF